MRRFLFVALLPGCGGSLAGTWDLVQIDTGSSIIDYPSKTEGNGSTTEHSVQAVIESDRTGTWTEVTVHDSESLGKVTDSDEAALTVEEAKGGHWSLDVADLDLLLDCEVDEETLTCVEGDNTRTLVRAE